MAFQRYMDVEVADEMFFDAEDQGTSGEESFFTDEELAYQESLDPAEDDDYEQDTASSTQAGQQASSPSSAEQEEVPSTSAKPLQASPSSSPEEGPSTSAAALPHLPKRGRGHGQMQTRSQGRPHGRARSRSRSGRLRGRPRGRRESSRSTSTSRSRSRSPQPAASTISWNTERQQDICPVPKKFVPAKKPGHQLNPTSTHTPLSLFKLFISNNATIILCNNTNKQAAKNIANGKKYSWTNITIEEFFRYVGLTFFFALVRLTNIRDYWRKNTIFSQQFPPSVMTRDRYQVISWNIHMSDPDEDAENDRKKGTPAHDRLFRLKPLLNTITEACKTFYHPRQNLSVDERMVATKAHTGMTQYMKAKPTKWGFKLFVLADSSNGYTLDFAVYTGKSQFASGVGLEYDSVMSLINRAHLGSGYNVYVDNFYTSPKLFKDLHSLNIGACGTYRDNRRGFPHTTTNALKKKDPRGSIRWIRDGPLFFVKWMDTREVSACSTIHQAFSGDTVQRRVKTEDGSWTTKSVPCPTPIMEYNKNMGGVDLSDQLIQYYSVHHKTMQWYRTLFFHFLDIAATNSYLLHKELCAEKQQQPMTHRAFLEELTAQLCGVTVNVPTAQTQNDHVPVPTSEQAETSRRASYGRKSCVHCRQTRKVTQSTPWKCKSCDVALCLIADRNCFEKWHK